jgi:hypothetical protein
MLIKHGIFVAKTNLKFNVPDVHFFGSAGVKETTYNVSFRIKVN